MKHYIHAQINEAQQVMSAMLIDNGLISILQEAANAYITSLQQDGKILLAGNDYSYEKLFARQVQAHGNAGDIFIGYSTSGASVNIIHTFEESRTRGLICIGFTGNRGGATKELCDYLVEIPSSDTAKIQEGHLVIGHILCGLVERAIFKVPN